MKEITTDLNEFGYYELLEASELLKAYANQLPDFLHDEPKIYFDEYNAKVFIQDADGNTAILNENGKLEKVDDLF